MKKYLSLPAIILSVLSSESVRAQVEVYSQEKEKKESTTYEYEENKNRKSGKQKEYARGKNLPIYFRIERPLEIRPGFILPETKEENLGSVRAGDIFEIEITHSIIAFPDEKAPVVAKIISGPMQGGKLFGFSHLETNSKRILIEFTRLSNHQATFEIRGSATTEEGAVGFIGEHHSREELYFAGDFLSSFVAGYFDAQVPRSRNAFGQLEEERSVDAAFKKGLSSSAMASGERFREKLKKVPEFSELKGPIKAKILIYEGGKRL